MDDPLRVTALPLLPGVWALPPGNAGLWKVKSRKGPAAHARRVGVRRRILQNRELAATSSETTS